jgi:hypothetical protein
MVKISPKISIYFVLYWEVWDYFNLYGVYINLNLLTLTEACFSSLIFYPFVSFVEVTYLTPTFWVWGVWKFDILPLLEFDMLSSSK